MKAILLFFIVAEIFANFTYTSWFHSIASLNIDNFVCSTKKLSYYCIFINYLICIINKQRNYRDILQAKTKAEVHKTSVRALGCDNYHELKIQQKKDKTGELLPANQMSANSIKVKVNE